MSKFGEISGTRTAAIDRSAQDGHAHIVDQLIAERGENLASSWAWPILKPLLHRILHYHDAVRMADEIASLSGHEAMAYVSGLLKLDLAVSGADRIPRDGAFILICNHPTGIPDGVAVHDALKQVRPDISIFTNRDAHRVNPRFIDTLIPVEWRKEFRNHTKTRETLRLSSKAFKDERAIVIFPAGRIAYWQDGCLNERPWQSSFLTLARKHKVPILPVHVRSRNSGLFYWFANWNTELRDMTIFHELLNKKGKTFQISFGPLIPNNQLSGDSETLSARLQNHCVHDLAEDPDRHF
jgi:putative hemolysin